MKKKPDRRIVPLAFDDEGNPLPIPEEAHSFRLKVRRGGAKRHQLVCGRAGTPLLMPVDVRPEEFQEQVGPGIYRLELVDENGYSLTDAPTLKHIVEREEEEDDPNATRAEAFVSKMLKEQRQLVTRVLDHVEHSSTEDAARRAAEAEEMTKRSAEHARVLAVQAERFEKMATSLAEQNTKAATAMLEQNTKLVTVMANKFGDYIAEATNLLAAHPAAGNAPTAADIVSEHKHIRNAVDDLSQGQGGSENEDNPLLSLIDKSLDTALPILAPALQRLVHRLVGLTDDQSNELSGVPTPVVASGSGPVETPATTDSAAPTPNEMARVMEVMSQLTASERGEAMAVQQSMTSDERARLRVELLTLPTGEAIARVRQILAERRKEQGAHRPPQEHLRAVIAKLTENERVATQTLLEALPSEAQATWRGQILSRDVGAAVELIRRQLAELATAMAAQAESQAAEATDSTEDDNDEDTKPQP